MPPPGSFAFESFQTVGLGVVLTNILSARDIILLLDKFYGLRFVILYHRPCFYEA